MAQARLPTSPSTPSLDTALSQQEIASKWSEIDNYVKDFSPELNLEMRVW